MLALGEAQKRYLKSLGILSGFCLGLFLARAVATGTARYWFIPENLALAWLSLLFAWLLSLELKHRRWSSWQNISLSLLWLVLLPNSWYVLTDFLHIFPTGEISQLYDIVMISSLVSCGFILGFTSLYLVHRQLVKRFTDNFCYSIVGLVILAASFAIYLGRDLRWSSWDVITNPGGIILNVSDRIIDPFSHPQALNVTALFFVTLSAMYLAVWHYWGPRRSSK